MSSQEPPQETTKKLNPNEQDESQKGAVKNRSGKESPDSHLVNGDRVKTRSSASGSRRVTRSEAAYGDASVSVK